MGVVFLFKCVNLRASIYTHTHSQSPHRWGKRAAHNRAQIVYYIAENLELRHDEVAQRIANMTGAMTTLDCCYSTVLSTGHM